MKAAPSIAFHTLGCKLNFSETATIGRQMEAAGFQPVAFDDGADIYVINTCSVTDHADKKTKNVINRALRHSPDAFIVIIGCYAQLKPQEIVELPGVDLVLGAAEKFQLARHLQGLDMNKKNRKPQYYSCDIEMANEFIPGHSEDERTRAFLKVQDGCDYGCTFCTIPLARGKSRSDTIGNVVRNAREIGAGGAREIVLTGVNTGDFGKGHTSHARRKEESFFDLVQVLDKVEEIDRFRISSIEPNLLHQGIIDFVAQSERFMPHFHMPLQSGSDYILKKMRRRYLSQLYRERVDYIKNKIPHCCIGVDVIVGFPGETEEEFMKTYRMLREMDISYLHVFTYSERPNTPANEMEGAVPMPVRKKRSKMLRILSDKKQHEFYNRSIGESRPVLWEAKFEEGVMSGYTDNYIRVEMPIEGQWTNEIKTVQLAEFAEGGNIVGKLQDTIPA